VRINKRILSLAAAGVLVMSVLSAVALPESSDAASPPFNQCPAAGADASCQVLITVNPDGSTSVSTDASQPAMSSTGVLIGIVNDSDALVSSVSLHGSAGSGAFALTGDGVCSVYPTPCFGPNQNGPTGYEGPGTSFSTTGGSTTDGTVTFAGGVRPNRFDYFSLASAPISVTSIALQSDIAVTATALSPFLNIPFSGQLGTFTDGYSTSPATDFSATIDWGDGSPVVPATVAQPNGLGTPYVVTAASSHSYASAASFPTTVTVTDTVTTAIPVQGSGTSTATVIVQPVTLAAYNVGSAIQGTQYQGVVATFTDADGTTTPTSFTASIDWGAQSNNIEQITPGTITQTGSGPQGNTFEVAGANTYTVSGDFTVTVSVTIDGITSTVSDPIEVNAQQVTVQCTGSCSTGTVATGLQTASATTTSTTGSLTVGLSNGTLYCGAGYDYAPQVTTVSTTGIPDNTLIQIKVTFPRHELLGPRGAHLKICFEANNPFTQADGTTTLPVLINGQTQYVGLLPKCTEAKALKFGPCVQRIAQPLPGWATVQEFLKFPAGDPRAH
jgi:hypothetical protein